MATNYTLTISDPNNLLGNQTTALVTKDMDYVMSYLSQYLVFQTPLDLEIVIRPSSENPNPTDGLLPSLPAWTLYNGQWTLAAMVKGQTGIDPNGGAVPDAGFTIYLGNDGTVRNFGDPVWFDPNPQLGVIPTLPNGSADFISIAIHELTHCFGFATWPEVNAPWNQHTTFQNGIWYYSSSTVNNILGGPLPLNPNRLPGQADDHIGNTDIAYQPVQSDLMYLFGNYAHNRWDIGQLDLAILKDLGWTIQNYSNLPLVDPLDQFNINGTPGKDTLLATKFSSIITGNGGDDTIVLPAGTHNGNYLLDGGEGTDTLQLPQLSSQFNIIMYGDDFLLQSKDGSEGVSLLRDIELITFDDGTVPLIAQTAAADSNGIEKGKTLTVSAMKGVLTNDADPTVHDHLTVASVNGAPGNIGQSVQGQYGTLTLNADGSYSYAAKNGSLPSQIVPQDIFTYAVSDGHGGSSSSTLTITVLSPSQSYQAGSNTTLNGGNGKDVLDGAAGRAILLGGNGPDVLIGGPGDKMTGGNGPDVYVFGQHFGLNIITDFDVNNDAIQVSKALFASVTDLLNHTADSASGAIIAASASDQVTLVGITEAQLVAHSADFYLV